MKVKKVLSLLIIATVIVACKKNNPAITDFQVSQNLETILYTYEIAGNVEYCEISYSKDPNDVGSNTFKVPENSKSTVDELGLEQGETYYFKIRAVGKKDKVSDWYGPSAIEIGSLCGEQPASVTVNGFGAYWSAANPQSNNVSYYEIEYGEQGFKIGEGTREVTNSTNFLDMVLEKDQTYDFYVRSLCKDGLGYSKWLGPSGFIAEKNKNLCMEPVNVGYAVRYDFFGDPTGAEVSWDDPGGNLRYEINMVGDGQSPDGSSFQYVESNEVYYDDLTINQQYDFYVRVVCVEDNTVTNWVGPLDVIVN